LFWVYESRSKLAEAVQNILAKTPLLYEGTGDHLVSEAFYFHDPEGNGLELYFDRPRDEWQWNNGRVAMATLYIDPENYIKQYLGQDQEAGEKHLGHVHLRVGDIPNARKFYVDILGFDITFDMPSALFLSVGGYHHHIGANTWMSQGASKRTPALGLAEFDIHLPSADDFSNLSDRLQKFEYKYSDKNGQLEVADPWGNNIVFLSE
jgi:catechol 2,3-dioxygenase